jgi:hypothetical protein
MVKRSVDDASEHLRQIWLAYEYPGRLVSRDIARLGRTLKRAYAALLSRDQSPTVEDDSENHLWAERRE